MNTETDTIDSMRKERDRYRTSLVLTLAKLVQRKYPNVFDTLKILPAIRQLLEADVSAYQVEVFFDHGMDNLEKPFPEFILRDIIGKFPKTDWTINDLKKVT